jgi:hypothetical protein
LGYQTGITMKFKILNPDSESQNPNKEVASFMGYTLIPSSILINQSEEIEKLRYDLQNTREMAVAAEYEGKRPLRWFPFWQKAVMAALVILILVLVAKYSKQLF